MRLLLTLTATLLLLLTANPAMAASACEAEGDWLQVLGSGGPELDDGRASSGYLIWRDGKARLLVEAGTGTALHFEQVGADLNDLQAIALTHLHVDHSGDLPALLKGGVFVGRSAALPLFGPAAEWKIPAVDDWLAALFAEEDGAYDYLGGYLQEDEARPFAIQARVIGSEAFGQSIDLGEGLHLTPARVIHGPLPALAWRVDVGEQSVAFTGDMREGAEGFEAALAGVDILVANHAIPEDAGETALNLHMPPSTIGRIAAQSQPELLLLSHRMKRSLGREKDSMAAIAEHYTGAVAMARDFACYPLAPRTEATD